MKSLILNYDIIFKLMINPYDFILLLRKQKSQLK